MRHLGSFWGCRAVASPSRCHRSTRIDLHAIRYAVSDVLLGDDANDIATPRHPVSTRDDRHQGVLPPHPFNDVKADCVLTHDDKVAAGDIPKGDAGTSALKTTPQARVDAENAVKPVTSGHYDVVQASICFVLAQKIIKPILRRQDRDATVHDLARMSHQKHIGVERLRNGAAAAGELERVNSLAR